jgi:putative oxidoreductase
MSVPVIARRWIGWAPYLLAILRIVAAFVFILAGTVKLFAVPIGVPPNGGAVNVLTEAWFGGVLEVFGGAFVLVGLFTRPVAFILSGEMAVAYFQYHAPVSVWPVVNNGIPAILYCLVWLYFSSAGAGAWSIDALRRKSPERVSGSR